MKTLSRCIYVLGVTALLAVTLPTFAESAPVYDADAMPQPFDNGSDQTQDLPPPPAPGQESAYVPASPTSNAAPQMSTSNLPMAQRVKRLEQQISNMQNTESAARIDSLQSQVQALQGQVEQLTHELQQVQTQQKSLYTDLDKRLSQKSTSPTSTDADATSLLDANSSKSRKSAKVGKASTTTAAADTKAKSADTQPNVAEEQQIYQTAYNLIKAKKYSEAVTALQSMLQKYPSGQFASNAHFWLGELYILMNKNDQALSEFETVIKNYPDSPRISDAQLKVGVIYASESKWSDAKSAFRKVINHFPGTASSRLASEQLKEIKQAGH